MHLELSIPPNLNQIFMYVMELQSSAWVFLFSLFQLWGELGLHHEAVPGQGRLQDGVPICQEEHLQGLDECQDWADESNYKHAKKGQILLGRYLAYAEAS